MYLILCILYWSILIFEKKWHAHHTLVFTENKSQIFPKGIVLKKNPITSNKKRAKELAKLILMGLKNRGNSELIYENYKNTRTSFDTINFHFKLEPIRFTSWFHEFKISKFTDILNSDSKFKQYVVKLTIYFCSLALIYF